MEEKCALGHDASEQRGLNCCAPTSSPQPRQFRAQFNIICAIFHKFHSDRLDDGFKDIRPGQPLCQLEQRPQVHWTVER